MPGSPVKRARREALEQAARSAPAQTLDVPAAEVALEAAAATALLRNDGDAYQSLADLGHDTKKMPVPEIRRLALTVFNHDVMRRLQNDLGDLTKQKHKLIARQVRIARWGSNNDATRAFQQLARVAGWFAPMKVDVNSKVVNIHTIMENPALLSEALAQFAHEPGGATAMASEVHERLAIEAVTIEGEMMDGDDDE